MEANIMGVVAIVVSAVTAIVGVINHKRLRSNCCGKEAVMSVDIEATTPPKMKPVPVDGHPDKVAERRESIRKEHPNDSRGTALVDVDAPGPVGVSSS